MSIILIDMLCFYEEWICSHITLKIEVRRKTKQNSSPLNYTERNAYALKLNDFPHESLALFVEEMLHYIFKVLFYKENIFI